MTHFLVLLSPFVVSILVQAVKKYVLPALTTAATVHSGWIVLSVAVLSYVISVLNAALTGGTFDPASSTVLVNTIISALGATGVFHASTQIVQAVKTSAGIE